jgi:hypothetical protein
MAVYKIFPEKDTFISQYNSTQNFGRDEILEISNETDITSINVDVKRTLLKFSTHQINNVINNVINGGNYLSTLKLFLANATLPVDYTIYVHPLDQTWDMGLGKSSDTPINTVGVTWDSSPTYLTSPTSSQTFLYTDNKDVNVDITNIVEQWVSSSIDNNGILLKLSSSLEDSTTPCITRFFSMDTHTIYPPQIEFKWDDSRYNTLLPIVTSDFVSTISNNKSSFEENTTYIFKIKSRDKYPTRQFSTTSVYNDVKVLPSTSYWGLKDVKTEEMVIDFDTTYTKISCDNISNYFKVYMNGLEPERYYQILYKTILPNGEVIVIDNKSNYFKIVR